MKRLGSLLLILAICVSLVVPAFATIEDKEQELKEIEAQQQETKQAIEATAGDISLTQGSIDEVVRHKQRLEDQIEATGVDITNKEEDIKKVQAQLKKAKAEVEAQQADYGDRLRVLYLNKDNDNVLSLLLKSRSIEDFLTKIQQMKSIVSEDQRVLDELKAKQVKVEELEKLEKANLDELHVLQEEQEADKQNLVLVEQALEDRKAELVARKQELEEQDRALEETSAGIRSSIESLKAEALRIQQERARQEAERLAAQQAAQQQPAEDGVSRGDTPAPPSGGLGSVEDVAATGFVWPTPGVYMITSPFGWRTDPIVGGGAFHSGVDIAGPINSPVVASASGLVVSAGWLNGMAGNAVVIAHPNGYTTLYAHGNAVACEVGQVVNQGDLIMYMGSTGYSTGSHLHFEVHQGDQVVNPLDYVSP